MQAAIAAFQTSQTNDNRIPVPVEIPRMGRQRLVNSVASKNCASLAGSGSSNGFISSMKNMVGCLVWEYQKSLLEISMSIQIITPIRTVKLTIIAPLRLIVAVIPIVFIRTFELC